MSAATAKAERAVVVRGREVELSGRAASGHLHFDRRLRTWRTHDEMVQAGLVDDHDPAATEGDIA